MSSLTHSSEDESVKFIFRFTVFEVIAQVFDRQMIIKFGLKTSVIQLDAIRYLYFRNLKDQKMSEITVAVAHKNTLRRTRIYADMGEESFEDLWHYLKHNNPDADISGLPTTEAYQLMGSQNYPWLAVSGVMSVAVLLIALLGSPLLRHGLDQGQIDLDLEQAYHHTWDQAAAETSRNITFRGWIDLEHAWRLVEKQGSYDDLKLVAPVYPPSIRQDQDHLPPARLVILARNDEAKRIVENPKVTLREGILRTIWWEGLGSLASQKLKKSGAILSPNAVLIEVGEIKLKRRDDLVMYLMSISVLSLITLMVTLYLKPAQYSSTA